MPVAAPPATETQYRSLSSLAVVGLVLGMASVMVFFIDQAWALWLLPLPALVASLVARKRIRESGGSLSGYLPATFGIVLSVACGLGWITHTLTKNWILETEAREFLEAWIRKLQANEECVAFLDTVEPDRRQVSFDLEPLALKLHFPPAEGQTVPQYDNYRVSRFVGMALRYGDKIQVRAKGRPEFRKYTKGTERHRLVFDYNCDTPQGPASARFDVISGEAIGAGGSPRRDWYVASNDLKPVGDPTAFGRAVTEASESADFAVEQFCSLIAGGQKQRLESLLSPKASRLDFEKVYNAIRVGLAPSAATVFNVRKPMIVLKEEQLAGGGWRFAFQGHLENQNREVEFALELETPDLALEMKGWRYVAVRFLGERRKLDSQSLPPPPANAPGMPETFRTK